MKQKLQKITKLILFCFVIILSSCEKDLYEEALEPRNELKIINVSLEKLSKLDNEKLFKKVNEIRIKRKKTLDKIIIDSINNFYFDDTNGIEIERQNGYKSYTFPINREHNDGKIENLLFSKKLNGEYDAYIVKYDFTEEELNDFTHKDITKRKVKYTAVNHAKLPTTGRLGVICFDNWTAITTSLYGDCTETHSNGVTCSPTTTTTWVLTSTDCYFTGGGDDSLYDSGISTVPIATNTADTGLEALGITREQLNWLKIQNTTLKAIIGTYTAEPEEGPSMSDVINYLIANPDVNKNLTDYLDQNNTPEAKAFAIETVNYFIANLVNSDSETNELFFKALRATNNFQDNLTESFVQDNISYFSQDLQNQILIDPLLAAQIAQEYLIQRAVKKYLHPNWNEVQIYYSVLWDLRHMVLDSFGLIPVFGEVADLANGTLYTIEGDKVNAAFSFASAVPVAGWAAVGVKYAVKIKTVATIGTKVKLTWKVLADGTIYFGSNNTCRAQLRKVLGLAVGNLNQAHHIIPLNLQTNAIVQKAFKSADAFHLNEALNGIPLSTAVHNGSHANYDNIIFQKLKAFADSNPNATPKQCYDKVVDIINEIRTAIQNSPNTPINQLNF
jgi:hypothetical protein